MYETFLALGIGVATGAILFGQVYVLRAWNRTLPLSLRPINYILGDGTLLAAFALWGYLTGHLAEVSAYCLILCLAGAFVVLAYAALARQEAERTAESAQFPTTGRTSEAPDGC